MPRLQLTPRQNQDFRLLLRVCRRSLVAIDGFGYPLVTDTLPLHHDAPSLLNALLAIAAQIRLYRSTGRPAALWDPYHGALREVQHALLQSASGTNPQGLLAAVAGAVILVILSIAGPNDDWQHHASHLVHLLDCGDVEAIKSTSTGLNLTMMAAHIDLGAFAIGRSIIPTSAWSRWRLDQLPQPQSPAGLFLPHEIATGWPASLLSIICDLDKCAALCAASPDNAMAAERVRLRALLDAWQPEHVSPDVSEHQRLAVLVARRTMHRAAMLYHARVYGFRANLLAPLDLAENAMRDTVEQVLIGIRHLVQDFNVYGIPTANAMAWPLAVAGSECGNPVLSHLQQHVLSLIEDIAASFSMSHLKLLGNVFRSLWQQQAAGHSEYLSLESVARDSNVTILLL